MANQHSQIATVPPLIEHESESETLRRAEQILTLLERTAAVMGAELPADDDALLLMASDLARLPLPRVEHALARCRREIRGSNGFAPKLLLPDILDRADVVLGDQAEQAEATVAWDLVLHVANKFLEHDSHRDTWKLRDRTQVRFEGGVAKLVIVEHIPEISQRVSDTVFRMGGWQNFRKIAPKNEPFIRKQFFEEFKQWRKVEALRPQLKSGEVIELPRIGSAEGIRQIAANSKLF